MKTHTRKKRILTGALGIFLLLAGFALLYCLFRSGSAPNILPTEGTAGQSIFPNAPRSDSRLGALRRQNPDAVAWLTIPGTHIDGAIMQYSNNDYYLRRNETGQEDVRGCLFGDCLCSFDPDALSRNLVIYGHTFDDTEYDGGFAALHGYLSRDFREAHPLITLTLPGRILNYEVISAGVCDALQDEDCILPDPDEEQMAQILAKTALRCPYEAGTADIGDSLLTLVTCTGDSRERLLVVGKLADKKF